MNRYLWPLFERNAIVRLFSDMGGYIYSMSIPTIKYYCT